jgi:uncharacterized protein YfaP (DUF2135 family)
MSKRIATLTLISILVMIVSGCGESGQSAFPASGQSASPTGNAAKTLMWDAPTSNTDGSSTTDLAGYKIYHGIVSGIYTASIDVGNVTSFSIATLSSTVPIPGTYYIVVTAYDTAGNESVYSNEISLSLPGAQ